MDGGVKMDGWVEGEYKVNGKKRERGIAGDWIHTTDGGSYR